MTRPNEPERGACDRGATLPGPHPSRSASAGRSWRSWIAVVVAAGAALALGAAVACQRDDDEPPPPKEPVSDGTVTGGLKEPPKNSELATEKRPPPAFRFEDVAASAGFTATNHSGTAGVKEYLVEAVGPGPACLDFDRDGLMDFYVPDGETFANYVLKKEPDPQDPATPRAVLRAKTPKPEHFPAHLYRNRGDGKFDDVAARAGVENDAWGFGALAWDYDGDGWPDLFVCNIGSLRLYKNLKDGTFADVAEAAGIVSDPTWWNTCATCGDYDNDGRLDLYVARYSDPAAEVERQRAKQGIAEGTPADEIPGRGCLWRGLKAYCGPIGLVAQQDTLYHQKSDGTFEDVSEEVGVHPKAAKYGFTSYFFDYDGDGLLDIYVANDSEENFLWHQERGPNGKIKFVDRAEQLGVKFGQNGLAQASMGNCIADINQDGLIDIFVTNFSHDYNNIFIGVRYPGGVSFKDRGLQVMGQAVFYDLSWGCGWYDFDNDADLDLFVANGHVYKEVDLFEKTGTSFEQYPAVFECLDAKGMKYREVGPKPFKGASAKPPPGETYEGNRFAGKGLEVKKACRAACFNDFDNDGDVDILVIPMNDTPIFLKNELPAGPTRRWLKLMPRMDGKEDGHNIEAIGATVTVTTPGGPSQMFPVYRCQSFLGTDDPRIHVGVGSAETATVTVTWPGPERKKTVYQNLATSAAYYLHTDGRAERVELKVVH